MPSEAVVFLSFVAMAGTFGLLFPVARAMAERLRARGRGDGAALDAMRALREDVLEEVQQVRREVAELAERVDFHERLLSRQQGAERLAPPRP